MTTILPESGDGLLIAKPFLGMNLRLLERGAKTL